MKIKDYSKKTRKPIMVSIKINNINELKNAIDLLNVKTESISLVDCTENNVLLVKANGTLLQPVVNRVLHAIETAFSMAGRECPPVLFSDSNIGISIIKEQTVPTTDSLLKRIIVLEEIIANSHHHR